VLVTNDLLKQRGVELFECDRGGDVTYHGPGQLVGYPIFDLRSFLGPDGQKKTLGAVEYVRRLEEALIRTCADYGIASERVAGMTGVWTQLATTEGAPSASSAEQQSKIAAIGVHISRGVTSHGFALNVTNEPLENFRLIVPCGITSKPVTSVEQQVCGPDPRPGAHESETRATPSMNEVAQSVARNFGRVFNSQIVWVDSLDALLGRAVDVPARAPEELRNMAGEKDTFWT
jgi:lipoyl(octanoyl) transferase